MKKGFTLIELLAVIIILAIIALIATPMVLNVVDSVKKSAAQSEAALVVGSEGNGISKLTKSLCDEIVSLPLNSKINSLNASIAGAISIYEVVRQRVS